MKNKTLVSTMLVIMLMLVSVGFAQNGNGNGQQKGKKANGNKSSMYHHKKGMNNIPNITDAQKEQIKKLRTENMKAMLPLKNSLMEKKAHLNTLSTSESVDMKAINKQIDEISKIKAKMMKQKAKMRQDVRALLTDDQRIYFDMHSGQKMGKGKGHHKGHKGNGNHHKNGNCRYSN